MAKSSAGGPKPPTKVDAAEEQENQHEEDEEYQPEDHTRAEESVAHAKSDTAAEDDDEALFNEAVKASQASTTGAGVTQESIDAPGDSSNPQYPALSSPSHGDAFSSSTTHSQSHARQPSLTLQSKIRSTSFRHSNGPLASPTGAAALLSSEGDTMPDIYRKQAGRIEELERENKRLAKEVEVGEERWRRLEAELEEVREQKAEEKNRRGSEGGQRGEIERLKSEIASLKAKQRERSGSMSLSKVSRSGSLADGSPSPTAEMDSLRKQIESKESTISDMSLEISRLRGQVSEKVAGCETHGSQIEALRASLLGSEERFRKLEAELADSRKAVARMSERSVKEGTEKTSREVRVRELERENAGLKDERTELTKQKQALDRKLETMNKLMREVEERHMKKVRELEGEIKRLRDDKMRRMGRGGDEVEGDGDGVDELEDEERIGLERKVRELEGEVFELRRGVYRERRGLGDGHRDDSTLREGDRPSFEADGFDEVDLSGSGTATNRRRSFGSNALLLGGQQHRHHQQQQQQQQRHSGFSQVLSSGLAAFRGTSNLSPDHSIPSAARPRNDSLLQDFNDEEEFDEAAFAQAQQEEEARKMVEHVREVKKKLREWKGYRLDLVEARRMMGAGVGWPTDGNEWYGEIFDV